MNTYFALILLILGALVTLCAAILVIIKNSMALLHPSFKRFVIVFTSLMWWISYAYPTSEFIQAFVFYKYILTGCIIAFFIPYEDKE